MYHEYKKTSSFLRNAIYQTYKHKCQYCGRLIPQIRYMHIDHILPTNMPQYIEEDVTEYIKELEEEGFIQDSIENYLPACAACNIEKNNSIYKASSLRYYHEIARKHLQNVLNQIEQLKGGEEYFYEPVDTNVWEQMDFKYQRGVEYAVMGYRLTAADVVSCPVFPQVYKLDKRLNIVDYASIVGETGCGKSITLFQIGYRFLNRGWQVYLLRNIEEFAFIVLPENTEKSLYLIDDAQIYSEQFIDNILSQARPNRKIVLAKTVSDISSSEEVVLTNADAVRIIYQNFYSRKKEIWPIVKECDNTVGVNMMDIPIERRLESARAAKTPWLFNYILRGGWKSMKDLYESIIKRNNSQLLAATIAVFQVLNLDRPVDILYINKVFEQCGYKYAWNKNDIDYLVKKKILISEDEIRIVHLESAYVISSLFFDSEKNEEQTALITAIEHEFENQRISSLGIVWLCNGCKYFYNSFHDAEEIFITDVIRDSVDKKLVKLNTSEEIRNMMYLLERIIVSSRGRDNELKLFLDNENLIKEYVNKVDSISAWGFRTLLNTLYNSDKRIHRSFCRKLDWNYLMRRMQDEINPDYYVWGGFFNRGILLLGKNEYEKYSDSMYLLMKWCVSNVNMHNVEQITSFICSVAFMNTERVHDLIPSLLPVYRQYFETDMKNAMHLFDFDFLAYICGIGFFRKNNPTPRQLDTANLIIQAIPTDKLAAVISESNMSEWFAIRDTLWMILTYNPSKFKDIMGKVDLVKLSDKTNNSWEHSHEICMVIDFLYEAGNSLAKRFIKINTNRITCYYSVMIAIDADGAIALNTEQGIPIELFTEHWWDSSFEALKALARRNVSFTREYLRNNIQMIAQRYSNVTALDFEEKYSLEILYFIKKLDEQLYQEIISLIDKDRVLEKWDKCGGINPRKKRWINKRKEEYLKLLST